MYPNSLLVCIIVLFQVIEPMSMLLTSQRCSIGYSIYILSLHVVVLVKIFGSVDSEKCLNLEQWMLTKKKKQAINHISLK